MTTANKKWISFMIFKRKKKKESRRLETETVSLGKLTVLFLNLLPPSLAVTGPVREAGAALAVGLKIGKVGEDFNPQHTVGEVAVVEGESKIRLRSSHRVTAGR